MAESNDPSKQSYVPYYDDPRLEAERLERCLQQQIEDCFTVISRIQKIHEGDVRLDLGSGGAHRWKTLREGLRCWRAAVRHMA